MGSHWLALRRVLTGCAAVGAVLLLSGAGCTTTASSPTISGKALTIYISDPASLASDQAAQDVVRAEQLAYQQLHSSVTAFQLSLAQPLTADKISSNGRAAIEDSHAIAYLGEVVPGTSADSIGITNSQDLLQVSPTDGAVALTQKSAAVTGSPNHYYESFSNYGHTFARLVPTTSHEATALVAEMAALGVRAVHIESDGSDYGRALASAIAAKQAGVSSAASAATADGIVYAGTSASAAASALNRDVSANPKLKLFVPSALALDGAAFVQTLSPAAQKALYATAPGVLPASLSPAARTFVSTFRSGYGHDPSAEAIFGYAAMQAVLHVLARAGSQAGNRGTVVSDFMKLSYADSVIGSYSIDRQGDTNSTAFVVERPRSGALVPVKAVQG